MWAAIVEILSVATWDSPPHQGAQRYAEFEHAFKSYLSSRDVDVKKKSKAEVEALEKRLGQKSWKREHLGVPEDGLYDIGQDKNLSLFDFQVIFSRSLHPITQTQAVFEGGWRKLAL